MFRWVVGGIVLSTFTGVVYAVTNRPAFVRSFPGAAKPTIYVAFLILAGLGFIALIGLLRWRPWALWLYGFLAVGSVGLDALANAPIAHEVTVIVATAAVFALAYKNRARFERAHS